MKDAPEPYVVRQGDHLSRLAYARGWSADDVWQLPENAKLRDARADKDMLCPGDILYLPVKPPRAWLPVSLGAANTFVAKVPVTPFSVVLRGPDGPYANEPYTATGAVVAPGATTDGDGKISLSVALTVLEVVVTLTQKKVAFRLRIGHLDPPGERSGARQRLVHLRYHADAESGYNEDGEYTQALRAFQRDQGLPVTGKLDDGTRDALVAKHGS